MSRWEILENIESLEAFNPNCKCRGWDCYDCYLTIEHGKEIHKLKQLLEESEDTSGGYGEGEL